MKIFLNTEQQILYKFRNGAIISEEDEMVLNKYAGIIQFNENKTAQLTTTGINYLDRCEYKIY